MKAEHLEGLLKLETTQAEFSALPARYMETARTILEV
jgi:hypothetical protein